MEKIKLTPAQKSLLIAVVYYPGSDLTFLKNQSDVGASALSKLNELAEMGLVHLHGSELHRTYEPTEAGALLGIKKSRWLPKELSSEDVQVLVNLRDQRGWAARAPLSDEDEAKMKILVKMSDLNLVRWGSGSYFSIHQRGLISIAASRIPNFKYSEINKLSKS